MGVILVGGDQARPGPSGAMIPGRLCRPSTLAAPLSGSAVARSPKGGVRGLGSPHKERGWLRRPLSGHGAPQRPGPRLCPCSVHLLCNRWQSARGRLRGLGAAGGKVGATAAAGVSRSQGPQGQRLPEPDRRAGTGMASAGRPGPARWTVCSLSPIALTRGHPNCQASRWQ